MLYGITTSSGKTSFMELKLDAYKAQESIRRLCAERGLHDVSVNPANFEYCACVLVNKALRNVANGTSKAREVKHLDDSVFTIETTGKAFSACLVPEEKQDKEKRYNKLFSQLYRESGALLASIGNYIENVNDLFLHDESGRCLNIAHDMQVVTGEIVNRESVFSQDLNDLISSAKVAMYAYLPEIVDLFSWRESKAYTMFSGITKPGYKEANHAIYEAKSIPSPFENEKISLLARLRLYRQESTKTDKALEKACNDFMNSLSVQESTVASLMQDFLPLRTISERTGYNLALVQELKYSIIEKAMEYFPEKVISKHTTIETMNTEIEASKARKEKRKEAKKASKKAHDKKRNATPERKEYLAQKARERRAREKAKKEAEKASEKA